MRRTLPALTATLALAGCAASSAAPDFDRASPTPSEALPVATAYNEAGLAIFRAAAADPEVTNLAVSPASIGLAFGMLEPGATGPVEAALRELFAYPADGEALLSAQNSLSQAIASDAGDGGVDALGETVDLPIVRLASSAWFDEAFAPDPDYVDTLGRYFGAEAIDAPLRAEQQASRDRIDAWVKDRTLGLIPKVMPDSLPGDDTVMILVNTLYLKAQWFTPFEPSTYTDGFALLDGGTSRADYMTQDMETTYVTAEDYDAVALPYVGGLEMVLVVPHEGSFEAVRDGLDADALAALDASAREGFVWVQMPKFTTEATVDLREVIQEGLGIEGLFDTIGLDGIGPELFVSGAVHATKVIVDERGTEAAAATAIGADAAGMPEYDAQIRADRPYLYLIRDVATGALLFAGQVLDPAAG